MCFHSNDNYQNLENPEDFIQHQSPEFQNNAASFLKWFKRQTTSNPIYYDHAKKFADIKNVDIYAFDFFAMSCLLHDMIEIFESNLYHDENYLDNHKLDLESRTLITATIFKPFFIAFVTDMSASVVGDEFTEKHTKIIKTVFAK